jgi:zinc protease
MAVMRALYGRQPYGHPANGTVASLKAISRSDIEALYRNGWTLANVTLLFSGDVTPVQARSLADEYFADWKRSAAAGNRPASTASGKLKGMLVVIDLPNSGQAAVAVAREGLSRTDQRFYRATLANAVLGGGYSARLNQEIRITRGLSYGSGSSLDGRREPGPFVAITQTRNDAADQVLALTLGEMRRLGSEPLSPTDLAARRSALTGGFGRKIETTEGLADIIADGIERKLPPAAIQDYLPSLLAVKPAEVTSVAAKLMPDTGSTIVIVGEAKQFADKLRTAHPDLVVIPIAELDLDSETLKK